MLELFLTPGLFSIMLLWMKFYLQVSGELKVPSFLTICNFIVTESVFLGTLSFGTKSCFSSCIFWFRGFSFALDSVFLLRIYDGNVFIVIKLYIF